MRMLTFLALPALCCWMSVVEAADDYKVEAIDTAPPAEEFSLPSRRSWRRKASK